MTAGTRQEHNRSSHLNDYNSFCVSSTCGRKSYNNKQEETTTTEMLSVRDWGKKSMLALGQSTVPELTNECIKRSRG